MAIQLVEFTADVFPYCKGDVVGLEQDEVARVAKAVENRNIDAPYKKYEAPKEEKESK